MGDNLGVQTRVDATFFILSKLLFFLVSYENPGLCGHAVIEKMQKIVYLSHFLPIFDEQKLVI